MRGEYNTKVTYVFDLDGTLCTHEDDYADAQPFPKRIAKVNKLHSKGNTIVIDTARGSLTKIDHRELTEKQLKKWGVKYDELRVGVKFYGSYYIDDKGIKDTDFFNG